MKAFFYSTISIFTLALPSWMCSKTRQLHQTGVESIRIGHGGGFAGIETSWTLTRQGIIRSEGKPDLKLKTRDVEQIFKNYHLLGLGSVKLMAPGNLYEFIEYQNDKGETHKIVWDASKTQEGNYKLFYNHMYHLIQKQLK